MKFSDVFSKCNEAGKWLLKNNLPLPMKMEIDAKKTPLLQGLLSYWFIGWMSIYAVALYLIPENQRTCVFWIWSSASLVCLCCASYSCYSHKWLRNRIIPLGISTVVSTGYLSFSVAMLVATNHIQQKSGAPLIIGLALVFCSALALCVAYSCQKAKNPKNVETLGIPPKELQAAYATAIKGIEVLESSPNRVFDKASLSLALKELVRDIPGFSLRSFISKFPAKSILRNEDIFPLLRARLWQTMRKSECKQNDACLNTR